MRNSFSFCSHRNGQWAMDIGGILYRLLVYILSFVRIVYHCFHGYSLPLLERRNKDCSFIRHSTVHSFLISELRSPDSISLVFSSMPYNWRHQINIDSIEVIDFLLLPTKIHEMKSSFRRNFDILEIFVWFFSPDIIFFLSAKCVVCTTKS